MRQQKLIRRTHVIIRQFLCFLGRESINDADLITLKPYNLFNVSSTKIKTLALFFETLIMTLIKTLIWTKIDESLSRKAN